MGFIFPAVRCEGTQRGGQSCAQGFEVEILKGQTVSPNNVELKEKWLTTQALGGAVESSTS